ncbi:MAG: hypothetical protein MUE73_04545 [Planctomycetes bacterium]|jgi:hypothetical protein|nr:hypothetical protein [Planctomycetota bacterium]
MGLAEKRAMEKAMKEWLPNREKELAEICGGPVPYEVDWTSFDGDAKGIEWLEHNGPQQVSMAFRGIGTDDLGRQALREGVKKVVLRNTGKPEEKQLGFEGGVLTLRCAFAQSPGGRFTDREIRTAIEAKL